MLGKAMKYIPDIYELQTQNKVFRLSFASTYDGNFSNVSLLPWVVEDTFLLLFSVMVQYWKYQSLIYEEFFLLKVEKVVFIRIFGQFGRQFWRPLQKNFHPFAKYSKFLRILSK